MVKKVITSRLLLINDKLTGYLRTKVMISIARNLGTSLEDITSKDTIREWENLQRKLTKSELARLSKLDSLINERLDEFIKIKIIDILQKKNIDLKDIPEEFISSMINQIRFITPTTRELNERVLDEYKEYRKSIEAEKQKSPLQQKATTESITNLLNNHVTLITKDITIPFGNREYGIAHVIGKHKRGEIPPELITDPVTMFPQEMSEEEIVRAILELGKLKGRIQSIRSIRGRTGNRIIVEQNIRNFGFKHDVKLRVIKNADTNELISAIPIEGTDTWKKWWNKEEFEATPRIR